jgi:hypothetical protein
VARSAASAPLQPVPERAKTSTLAEVLVHNAGRYREDVGEGTRHLTYRRAGRQGSLHRDQHVRGAGGGVSHLAESRLDGGAVAPSPQVGEPGDLGVLDSEVHYGHRHVDFGLVLEPVEPTTVAPVSGVSPPGTPASIIVHHPASIAATAPPAASTSRAIRRAPRSSRSGLHVAWRRVGGVGDHICGGDCCVRAIWPTIRRQAGASS